MPDATLDVFASRLSDLDQVRPLIERGALVVINDSGGKDSQAMKILLRRLVRACGGSDDQLLVVHADLYGMEWQGTEDHVRRYSEGLEVRTARAVTREGAPKTLLGYWEQRGQSPSPTQRWCTSDLKRGPLEKVIRQYIKEKGLSGLVLNCMGIRAAEGQERSCGMDKKAYKEATKRGEEPTAKTFGFSDRNSKAGREWYDWYPIFELETDEVFATIAAAGETRHWIYERGLERASCCFCIYATRRDLTIAAELHPELYAQYVEMERKTGFTLIMPRKGVRPETLEEITGIPARPRRHLHVVA